ncbi:MAG: EAL domain-containing protein [Thermodesulfobacteriota bacterium]|nr:EAL domain-containing protein [Thermodesulfobacteriota bacterium]
MEQLKKDRERILIVDDTPANIDLLGAMLFSKYDISVAVNGPMAIEIAGSNEPPDLILLDIMMPEMNGYEVAKKLKSNKKTEKIPVIFVTAKIEEKDEAFGFSMGAVDYIRKPVCASVALARVKSQLELKRYRDDLAGMVEAKTFEAENSIKLLEDEEIQRIMVEKRLKTSKESAHKNLVYFRELFMNSPYGIVLVGIDNKIIRANNSFSKLVGFSTEEIINKKISDFSVSEECKNEYNSLIKQAMTEEKHFLDTRCFHKKGFHIHVSARACPVKINGDVQGVFVIYENISQRKMFENKLKHQAYHDALTGIPNRTLLMERIDLAIKKSQESDDFKFAVFLMDLDRFKSVNDSLGHQAGDKLLKSISSKVQECLRSVDTIARLGGDEFAILLEDVKDNAQVANIASRIKEAAEAPFLIDKQKIQISASIGIVIKTENYENSDNLMRDADLAMYDAKDTGKAQFKFFTSKMREKLMESIIIENELRTAVDNNEFTLYYQPIINLESNRVEGFEALVRWNHPDRGIVAPDNFIPIAEETGLIIPMGEWITNEACRQLACWREQFQNYHDLTMSINISIKQFLQKDFTDFFMDTALKYNLPSSSIKIEFTESLLMEHTESAVKKFDKLREYGFLLVIDDFGTGYSSLSYLHQFPIDTIKIDRSFINSMGNRAKSLEIVKSIISLSKNLGLSLVAEGVEKRDQLKTLAELSCESAQGYYFAKPLCEKSATDFLINKGPSKK